MIFGIVIAASVFLLSTAIVLWLCYRAPIIEECDCEECQAARRRWSHSSVPAQMTPAPGSKGTSRSRNRSANRRVRMSPGRKARMVRIDDRVKGTKPLFFRATGE